MNRRVLLMVIAGLLASASSRNTRGQFGPTTQQTTPGADPPRVIAVRAGRLFDGKSEPSSETA